MLGGGGRGETIVAEDVLRERGGGAGAEGEVAWPEAYQKRWGVSGQPFASSGGNWTLW